MFYLNFIETRKVIPPAPRDHVVSRCVPESGLSLASCRSQRAARRARAPILSRTDNFLAHTRADKRQHRGTCALAPLCRCVDGVVCRAVRGISGFLAERTHSPETVCAPHCSARRNGFRLFQIIAIRGAYRQIGYSPGVGNCPLELHLLRLQTGCLRQGLSLLIHPCICYVAVIYSPQSSAIRMRAHALD